VANVVVDYDRSDIIMEGKLGKTKNYKK